MAVNLKIEGNFLVATDTVSYSDIFRLPKTNGRYMYSKVVEGDITYHYFDFYNINHSPGVNFVNGNRFEFSDIIDDTTGANFNRIEELHDFLSTNLG